MKVIVISDFGGTEQLQYTDIPKPGPADNEVLVRVKAISINPVDTKTRGGKGIAGRFRDQLPLILGWDLAGVVEETGSAVKSFKAGDAVFGMVNFPGLGKAYAEYVAAPEGDLALLPPNASFEEAAATTLAALTALQSLREAGVGKGSKVLVHSAAGGVGHYAVQIAKTLGAQVTGTSSAENRDFVLQQLGADAHIDYKAQRFEEAVSDLDFVLDTIGGENARRSISTLKKGGVLISIPTKLAADIAEEAEAAGVRVVAFMVRSSGEDIKTLAGMLERGSIRPELNRYAFDEMAAAHAQQESGATKGKIVLSL